jgi:hypothetical protein
MTPIPKQIVIKELTGLLPVLPDLVLDSPTIEGIFIDFVSKCITRSCVISVLDLPSAMGDFVGADGSSKFAASVLSKVATSDSTNAKKVLHDASDELTKIFGSDVVPSIIQGSNGDDDDQDKQSDPHSINLDENGTADVEALSQMKSKISQGEPVNDILAWIQTNIPEELFHDETFVIESMLALLEKKRGPLSDEEDITLLTRILQSCSNATIQVELQAKALAAIAHTFANQKSLLEGLIEKIYNQHIISVDAFTRWKSFLPESWKSTEEFQLASKILDGYNNVNDEEEGEKGKAVSTTTTTEEEDDDENDGNDNNNEDDEGEKEEEESEGAEDE